MKPTQALGAALACAALLGGCHNPSAFSPMAYQAPMQPMQMGMGQPVQMGLSQPMSMGLLAPAPYPAMTLASPYPLSISSTSGLTPAPQIAAMPNLAVPGAISNPLAHATASAGHLSHGALPLVPSNPGGSILHQAPARRSGPSRHLNLAMLPGSRIDKTRRQHAITKRGALAPGLAPTPGQDLHYRGGRTIANLKYANIYVGGNAAWNPQERKSIDHALAAAMTDPHLNNVMLQYFNNQPITNKFLHSYFLDGYQPQLVTQGDVEGLVRWLYQQGFVQQFDVPNTVFNFMLPRGTVLNDDSSPSSGMLASQKSPGNPLQSLTADGLDEFPNPNHVIPKPDQGDSQSGLGGYHGSVRIGGAVVYYAVGVYSERRANGTPNGIPAFDQPWKNVVATFYHELQEARTDPDVEDAIRGGDNPNGDQFLGWTSDAGEEIGDFPVDEANAMGLVFQEVPLADGSGTVPVQFMYSNAVHGPEGPIASPHPQPAQ